MNNREFLNSLAVFRGRWCSWLAVGGLLRAFAIALLVFIAVGCWDGLVPFDDAARRWVSAGLLAVAVFFALRYLLRAVRVSRAEAARHADAALGDVRLPVLSALDLSQSPPSSDSLGAWLSSRALTEATQKLRAMKPAECRPLSWLRRQMKLGAVAVAVAIACAVMQPQASWIIAQRLLFPERDIPPWSPLRFVINPETPEVIYGGDAEIEAAIEGGPVRGQVWFMTREAQGDVRRSAAFSMGGPHFGQRLEKVTSQVEFAFGVGRARSKWSRIELLRQPRVEAVALRVTPPSYSGLPEREFALGITELAALPGSHVEARVRSNRPLSGGTVSFSNPGQQKRDIETLQGETIGEKEVRFRWQVKSAALVRIDIKDIVGTSSAVPLELEQKLVADKPPEVSLQSPAGVVLATPESDVPIEASVDDDLGLGRIDMVRNLSGFRDRAALLAADAGGMHYEYGKPLALAKLGVAPGQTLEFYVEAHDHNPSLMGIGSSQVGRIQIISVADYAELVRMRTTMEEFTARFRLLDEAMREEQAALEQLRDAPDAAARDLAMKRALNALRSGSDLAKSIAKDFNAFDMEKKLSKTAGEIAKMFDDQARDLELAKAGGAEAMKKEAERQLAQMKEKAESIAAQKDDAEKTAAVGKVMELTAEFREMHERQKALTAGMEKLAAEVAFGNTTNLPKMAEYTGQEARNLEQWKLWEKEMKDRALALPSEFAKLREDTLAFAKAAEEARIKNSMEQMLEQARKDKTGASFINAQFALTAMEQLMRDENNSFAQTAQKKEPSFSISKPDLAETMRQMLAGMCKKHGGKKPGKGQGAGREAAGPDSQGADGFSTDADPSMQAPLFGPDRLSFSKQSGAGSKRDGRGPGDNSRPKIDATNTSGVKSEATRGEVRRQISLRDVPEQYRDAVRKFYGDEAVREGGAAPDNKTEKKP